MRREVMILLLVISAAVTASAGEETRVWSSLERDVWIDQSLERPILLYRDDESYLLLSEQFRQALVFDTSTGEAQAITKASIELSDDFSTASTPRSNARRVGRVVDTGDGVLIATVGSRNVVIASHQSPAGEIASERLLGLYPVWRAKMASYRPDIEAVDALREINEPVELSVVFATWCGDSRTYVPRILKAVEEAGNLNIRVKLIGIDSEFQQPVDVIHDRRITNVPTVIVERNGHELGRIVETPAAETMEADLVSIMNGNPKDHQGRWSRETRISHGAYRIDLEDGTSGVEDWEIFATETGGRLTHSVISSPGIVREIWHRFDHRGRTEFIEITDTTEEAVQRSRIRAGSDRISVVSRGNRSGIIDQFLGVPADCVFATGSVLSGSMECAPLVTGAVTEIVRYAIPLEECSGVGCLETVRLVRGATTSIDTVLGNLLVSEIELQSSGTNRTVWIAEGVDVPVRFEEPGRSAVLIEFALADG